MEPCKSELQSLASVPPSVQAVYCAMYGHEPMTGATLQEETGLARRTVYSALKKLKDIGVLKEQLSLRDSRQTFFWLEGASGAA
ncbi:MAG: helix-turn-helix domain-containing protein [Thermoplasmatota archaeon]